jgi:hypothetical protein
LKKPPPPFALNLGFAVFDFPFADLAAWSCLVLAEGDWHSLSPAQWPAFSQSLQLVRAFSARSLAFGSNLRLPSALNFPLKPCVAFRASRGFPAGSEV